MVDINDDSHEVLCWPVRNVLRNPNALPGKWWDEKVKYKVMLGSNLEIYELYADFALKNPFYSLEMPIRVDLFEEHLQVAFDQIERTGFI